MTINQEANIMVNISDAAAAKSKEILKAEGKTDGDSGSSRQAAVAAVLLTV